MFIHLLYAFRQFLETLGFFHLFLKYFLLLLSVSLGFGPVDLLILEVDPPLPDISVAGFLIRFFISLIGYAFLDERASNTPMNDKKSLI